MAERKKTDIARSQIASTLSSALDGSETYLQILRRPDALLIVDETIIFHEDHILAVHDIHRQELVAGMDEVDLKELTQWLAEYRTPKQE